MSTHNLPLWLESLCSECGGQAACSYPGNIPACPDFTLEEEVDVNEAA